MSLHDTVWGHFPPSSSPSPVMFHEVHEDVRKKDDFKKDNKSKCDELKCEHKTLVISCKVELEEGGISTFHLHYRYFKGILYCFVEESYEAPDQGRVKIESPSPSDTSVVLET
jgi:hypothetical protein